LKFFYKQTNPVRPGKDLHEEAYPVIKKPVNKPCFSLRLVIKFLPLVYKCLSDQYGREPAMPDVVREASIGNVDILKPYIETLFKRNQYAEIIQAIGMHSLLIDPEHTIRDQAGLYRLVLNLVKNRVRSRRGDSYAAWYADFPASLDELVTAKQLVTDKSTADVLASRRSASGPFKSVDDFFFWALQTDRRLALDQIVKYIEKTAETNGK
jgi:hypothetical protein